MRTCALDVEVEGELEVVVAAFEQRAVVDDAGAVEEHVDAADLADGLGHLLVVEDVEDAGRDARHAVELGELFGVDVGGDDGGAGLGERLDRGAADALRRGGDQRHFAR